MMIFSTFKRGDNSQENPRYSSIWKKWFYGCSMVFVSFIVFLLLLEFFPRYIGVPVSPPDDVYGEGQWRLTTTMILKGTGLRTYILRKEGWINNDQNFEYTWDSIISYFDDALAERGWVRGDNQTPCDCEIYFPESEFLGYGEGGYVNYRKKGYSYSQDYHLGDEICLAVWPTSFNEDGSPVGFKIIIQTANPTPLTFYLDAFF